MPKVGNSANESNFATKGALVASLLKKVIFAKGSNFTEEVELAEASDLA